MIIGEALKDRVDIMGRGDELDVLRAHRFELPVFFAELIGRDDLADIARRDVVILAKDTAQVAAAEEDRTRAAGTADGRLFIEMQG